MTGSYSGCPRCRDGDCVSDERERRGASWRAGMIEWRKESRTGSIKTSIPWREYRVLSHAMDLDWTRQKMISLQAISALDGHQEEQQQDMKGHAREHQHTSYCNIKTVQPSSTLLPRLSWTWPHRLESCMAWKQSRRYQDMKTMKKLGETRPTMEHADYI